MKYFIYPIKSCLKGASTKSHIIVCLLLITTSFSSVAQISRTTIMSNANSFSNASYTWTAIASNKWWGTYCGGKYIYYANPSAGGCVVTGTNYGMPYAWGGWSTISQHNSAMSSGKSAGDICSSGGGGCSGGGAGTSCTSGMDCSGYLSRDWQLSSKYSTTGLDGISTPILISYVQQGDIFNLSGSHVRLFKQINSSGLYECLEASSTGWRVQTNSYSASALSSYTPRVFNNSASCGTPSSVYLQAITPTTVTLNWTASGVSSYTYYLKLSGSTKYTVYGTYTYKPVTFTGLSAGTTYNFKVQANCSNGTWGISSAITFTTPTSFAPTSSTGIITVEDGSTTTGISEEQNAINQVSIFPNPVQAGQEISVEVLPEKTTLTIYSLEGKLVTTVTAQSGSFKLNLPANMPPAVYIANLKAANGFTENKRLVVTQ